MSRIRIVAPHEDLLQSVFAELRPEWKNYSRSCIVFPGKRPAHFMRKHIARKEGTPFLPPVIFSIEGFIEHLYRELPDGTKRLCPEIDALAILFETHLQLGGSFGEGSMQSLESFLPAGRKLLSEMEELVLADCTVPELRRVLRGVDYPRYRTLADYFESFYRTVDRRGYITRAGMYREAAEASRRLHGSDFDQMILAGFFALTRIEQKLFSVLSRRDNVVMFFQNGEGLRERLAKYGLKCEIPDFSADCPAELQFTRSPDTHGQVIALASDLQAQIGTSGVPDERTAVVLPSSESLFPVIHHALSLLQEDEYNIALGFPLARTPIFGFLSCLMDLVETMQEEKVSPAVYLKFVLHPYTKNIRLGRNSEVTRILFHALEEHLVSTRSGSLVSLAEMENDNGFFTGLERQISSLYPELTAGILRSHLVSIHDRTVRRFASFTSCADFAARAIDVLSDIFDHSTARLHPFSRRYAERLISLFETLRSSLLGNQTFGDPAGYFSFFRFVAASETVPFPGTPLSGLQVLGLLETRNIGFETLYILNATEDVLPGSPAGDLLLPHSVRVMLGLETYTDREKLLEYYLNLAVRSAKKVCFYYSEGGAGEKSRFVQKFLWQLQKRDRTVSAAPYEKVVKYSVRLANNRPDPVPKTPAMIRFLREMHHSAFSLDTFLRCPLRFYYYYILNLREKEEVSDELDPLRVGTIVHDVLAAYFRELVGRKLRPDMFVREKLENIINVSFSDRFGKELTGTAWLLRRQITEHLWMYIEQVQIPLVRQHQITIKAIERNITVAKNGYQFTGRIDRIELRDSMNMILDYKTGKDDTAPVRPDKLGADDPATWPDAIRSFQLPLYMLLYSAHSGTGLDVITPAYLLLGKNHLDPGAETGLGSDDHTPLEIYQVVEPVIFSLLGRLTDESIPFEQTAEPEKECPGCEFRNLCGMQWIQGRND